MTIVARFKVDNIYPIIIGDLLLSAPEQPGRHIVLPTIEDITDIFPEGSGYGPSGLQQKIAVVADNLVIGWAGSRIAAKAVISDLYTKSQIELFTKDSLADYFASIQQHIGNLDIEFTGFIKDADRIIGFSYPDFLVQTHRFGKISLLGTGRQNVQGVLDQFSELPPAQQGDPNIFARSLAFALGLTGFFLNEEMSNAESLLHFFGGGYEIATFVRGKFQKLDDIMYVFWNVRIDNNGEGQISLPYQVFSYAYSDDLLLIRSIPLSETQDHLSARQSIYGVSPIYREVAREEWSRVQVPTLDKKWLCNYFLVSPPSGQPEIFARVDHRGERDSYLRFLEEGQRMVMSVEDAFIQRVAQDIFGRFQP